MIKIFFLSFLLNSSLFTIIYFLYNIGIIKNNDYLSDKQNLYFLIWYLVLSFISFIIYIFRKPINNLLIEEKTHEINKLDFKIITILTSIIFISFIFNIYNIYFWKSSIFISSYFSVILHIIGIIEYIGYLSLIFIVRKNFYLARIIAFLLMFNLISYSFYILIIYLFSEILEIIAEFFLFQSFNIYAHKEIFIDIKNFLIRFILLFYIIKITKFSIKQDNSFKKETEKVEY